MSETVNQRYLDAKRRYENRHGSITEHNIKLRVELLQYAMRKSLNNNYYR